MLLHQLANHFKSPLEDMPSELMAFWNWLRKQFNTAQDKRLLQVFMKKPTEQNLQKIKAILKAKNSPTEQVKKGKKGSTKTVYASVHQPGVAMSHNSDATYLNILFRKRSTRRKPLKKAAKKAAPKKAAAKKAGADTAFRLALRMHKTARKKVVHGWKKRNRKRTTTTKADKVTCYTRVVTEKQLVLRKPASVTVTISRETVEKLTGKLNKSAAVQLTRNKPLRVQLRAIKDILVVGEDNYKVPVPKENLPATIIFKIKGTYTGTAKFAVDVWQGFELACTLAFTIQINEIKATAGQQQKENRNYPTGKIVRDINQIIVWSTANGKKSIYHYMVKFKEIDKWENYQSKPIDKGLAAYIRDLYAKIEQLYQTTAGVKSDLDTKIRTLGAALFKTLFPDDLQTLFYKNRRKIKSIQIVSDEPYIPWEMILIRNPDKAKPMSRKDVFFADLGVTRWILRGSFPEQILQCRRPRNKFVIPSYNNPRRSLPAAAAESQFLRRTLGASQVPATPKAVETLLKKGGFDLLHFCCHGEGENNEIGNARLVLEEIRENAKWLPTYLEQEFVEQCGTFIKKGAAQPIIVLNGCRTAILGKKLLGYGGFAKAFLDAGAAVFVGGLWALEDQAAFNFIQTFYNELKKGRTLSAASITARQVAKTGDATWLSYVVYGNPFAKLAGK